MCWFMCIFPAASTWFPTCCIRQGQRSVVLIDFFLFKFTPSVAGPFFCRREKYRLLKAQRAAQGKEAVEEHEEELKSVAALYAKQMKEAEKWVMVLLPSPIPYQL